MYVTFILNPVIFILSHVYFLSYYIGQNISTKLKYFILLLLTNSPLVLDTAIQTM